MIHGEIIADVGSDHAYLPIWLYLNQKIKKAYALDISENCVDRIKTNLQKYHIPEDIIIPVLSDGLSCFENNNNFQELTDIIIAGMGGETIAGILHNPRENINININYILQPNSKIIFLKKYLHKNKFEIIREEIVQSKKKFYTIINAKLKRGE